MRRLLATLLLAVFGLPMLLPALALGPGADAGLPACCRRMGQHHCAMTAAERAGIARASQAPAWQGPVAHCPYCPATVPARVHPGAALLPAGQRMVFSRWALAPGLRPVDRAHRLAVDRARPKRGPPSATSV